MRIYDFNQYNQARWSRTGHHEGRPEPGTFLKKAAGGEDMVQISPLARDTWQQSGEIIRLREEREKRLRDYFTEKVIMRATRHADSAFPDEPDDSLFNVSMNREDMDTILRKTAEILGKQLL